MSYDIIPTSAPFDDTQRAWLNGFLSGFLGVSDGADSNVNGNATTMATTAVSAMNGIATNGLVPNENSIALLDAEEDFPWKDDSLPILDRVQLSEGRPIERRLMSAMAQLDCGTCGYVCQSYSEAIANGEEKNLKLCTPGGKETSKMIKQMLKVNTENGKPSNGTAANGAQPGNAAKVQVEENASKYSRTRPFSAVIIKTEKLSKDCSAKHISHVEIDLSASDLKYNVGDALGVIPSNCPDLVHEIIAELGVTSDETVETPNGKSTFEQALAAEYDLASVTDELVELIATEASAEFSEQLADLLESDELDELDVLDLLQLARENAASFQWTSQQFVDALTPLAPRLYSIASSMRKHSGQVHLTIGRVETEANGRARKGVASTMFSDRTKPGDSVRVFVQPSHGFSLPDDPKTPIIMVGPGTGVAPFRAFLQERSCDQSPGESWLFFGDQTRAGDFIYEEELTELISCDALTRLDLAFSRDQKEKVYVQNRMLQNAKEIFTWLQRGAHLYVCGDAKRMAVDVDNALQKIVATEGGLDESGAKAFIKQLKSSKRYQRDVY